MDYEEGDYVEVDFKGDKIRGIIMPKHSFSGEDILLLKLDNGYNIGIKKDHINNIKIISKKSIEEKTYTIKREIKKGEKKITIINTGGTIASYIDYKTGAVKPAETQEELLLLMPELTENYNINGINLFSILSENIEPEHWIEIARNVYREIKNSDSIIITHGTDTMAYSASMMAFMIQNLSLPVIFVGSQRSSDRPSSDAYINLLYSLKLSYTDLGEVVVSMHGSTSDDYLLVHRGVKVRKMHTSRRDAFKSINTFPIAKIDNEGVKFLSEYIKRSENPILMDKIEKKVSLLYFYPNMDPEIVHDIGSRVKGIILAGTGLGHVSTKLLGTLKDLIKNDVFIGVTSQCLYGTVNLNVYSTGREMIKAGIIPLGDMLPEVAYVKLMWVLGNGLDPREIMTKNLVGELTDRRVGYEYGI
ncbi:MAG: Glu-tRNA(Gln) amidotransferase subunit GatD [Thermoplasmata archaeon]